MAVSDSLAETIETLNEKKGHLVSPLARQASAGYKNKKKQPIIGYKFLLGFVQGMGMALGWLVIQIVIRLASAFQ